MKPRLFIGSSVEGLLLARAVQADLDHEAEVTIWDQGVFQPSRTTLEDLVQAVGKFHFALFVFSPDDVTTMRGQAHATVRDNVIFEAGLFIGQLGRTRVFFLVPRGVPDLHLPTDLLGITPVTFDPNRSDGNLQAAVGAACTQIGTAMRRTGPP